MLYRVRFMLRYHGSSDQANKISAVDMGGNHST